MPLAVAGAAAVSFRLCLPRSAVGRIALLLPLASITLALPAFVDGPPHVRLYVAMACWTLAAKIWDLHRGASLGRVPGWGNWLGYLASPFSMVERRLSAEPRPRGRAAALLAWEGALAAGIAAGLFALLHVTLPRTFALEHAVLAAAGVLAMTGGMDLLFAGWVAAGGRGRRIMDRVWLARTPADFWRRWNRPIGQFLFEDVARPAAGRRLRSGLMFAFAVSAVIHEYIAAIAIGRVQGFQAAFFLIQGVAVACTARIEPRGPWAVPAGLLTVAFNLASSLLVFASLRQIFRWYASPVPHWMIP